MSVAEKLGALYEDHRDAERTAAVLDALPQIVAVVEAAEKRNDDHHEFWSNTVRCPLCDALFALDEALSPPTGGSP